MEFTLDEIYSIGCAVACRIQKFDKELLKNSKSLRDSNLTDLARFSLEMTRDSLIERRDIIISAANKLDRLFEDPNFVEYPASESPEEVQQ